MTEKPVAANPGKECVQRLDSLGIPSVVFPSGDEILEFSRLASDALPNTTVPDRACIKREFSLIVHNAKSPFARKVARDKRDAMNKLLERLENKELNKGTTLVISAPRTFEGFR